MKRSENRILTTHVGSIVRPQPLRDLAAVAGESAENQQRYEQALARVGRRNREDAGEGGH